jgi:flagellar motor switch protein FliN/FliY
VSSPEPFIVPTQAYAGQAAPPAAGGGLAADVFAVDAMPLPELGLQNDAAPAAARDLGMLADVPLQVEVVVGRVRLPLRDLLSLAPGMVVELDRRADAPVDVMVNGRLVAQGEVVVVGEEYGVRITSVVDNR